MRGFVMLGTNDLMKVKLFMMSSYLLALIVYMKMINVLDTQEVKVTLLNFILPSHKMVKMLHLVMELRFHFLLIITNRLKNFMQPHLS